MFWFWTFVGPALVLALFSLRGERKRADYVTARMAALDELPTQPPPVGLIVALNGGHGALPSLAAQDYPDYELIVAVSGANSIGPGLLPSGVKFVFAGETTRAGLLEAGIRAARKHTQVYAFADSGGEVPAYWLRALVAPLSESGVDASTGFRWYAPEPPSFWSLMRSVWNAVLAGRLGPGPAEFTWPGSFAIHKELFFGHPEVFLGRAAFAAGAISVYPERVTAGAFLRQARREMAQARGRASSLWWRGLLSHFFYCGAMLAAVIASARGNRGAEWALVVQFGLGMLKGANRATLAKAQLPDRGAWFDRYSWTHTLWVPLATWVWLYVMIASIFTDPDSEW